MLSCLVLTSFLLIVSSSPSASSWSLFPSRTSHPRFTSEKLLDLGSVGLPKTGSIASWGHFNQDQFLDLVYLSYDQRSVSVWNWNPRLYTWVEDNDTLIRTQSDFVITNVVPGDFDRDGRLDLILMGEIHPGWTNRGATTQLLVYTRLSNGSFAEPRSLDSSSLPQPIPFDATGTMTTSLFGFSPTSSSSSSSLLPQLWLNTASSPPPPPTTSNDSSSSSSRPPPPSLFTLTPASTRFDFESHPTGTWTCTSPHPHSNQFLDLDGDCLADVFLTCLGGDRGDDEQHLRYEIWINEKGTSGGGGGKFVWKRGGDLPPGTKGVSFSDIDRDGTLDMVLTVCPPRRGGGGGGHDDCRIEIAYNDQIPLCTNHSGQDEECRELENLCVADPDFGFDFAKPGSSSKFSISSNLIPRHDLITNSQAFRGNLPTLPQVGDYNIDGYPDLLVLVSPRSNPSQRLVKLLESRPCTVERCTREEIDRGRRSFELVTSGDRDEEKGRSTTSTGGGVEELEKFKDVETANWIDLNDDGTLDIVIQRTGQSGAARQIHFIKNNFFHDAFFLKAIVLNGACQSWCQPKEPGSPRYKPYGSSYSGASFKFTVLDPTGARRSTQYAQLPSTSYLSLGLPYAYLGLGRTNNYVENLFIGSTRSRQPQHFINLEGVIPNSQVLILPYQSSSSEEGEGGDVGEWKKELYLKPGDWIPWVTIVLVSAILGLGIVVFVLHLNEKREDEVERRARLLSLNFGAL